MDQASTNPWRLSVAPMMDWTDRHCRHFHRLLTRRTRLYTEMVTTGALIHGDQPRHLDFGAIEHPVALQLGGSEPDDLAACARLAERWGYDEVNLNCGCPSERVQRGAFGACLMNEPALVADGVKAMRDACSLPVTVKHRIGIDRIENYGFVRDFVGTLADAGCEVFVVHARNAWLQGLSPKDNREIPPLRYEFVHRLKRELPQLTIVVNGGLKSDDEIAAQLVPQPAGCVGDDTAGVARGSVDGSRDCTRDARPDGCLPGGDHGMHGPALDGVMIGRQAYHEPWQMAGWDERFFGVAGPATSREQVESAWIDYLQQLHEQGQPWMLAMRHALGLYNGQPGARAWRQFWSNHLHKTRAPLELAHEFAQRRPQVGPVLKRSTADLPT
ncbi:MAG: tRNA dihydrouridine(20/20a) synthase DusA [Burkholderiales bacterium]|nr:tRNA dihydrouridine(20/20a) synthase DusA [Burkholderiales bacterium]